MEFDNGIWGCSYKDAMRIAARVLEIEAHKRRAYEARGNYIKLRAVQCEHGRFCQHDACWCNGGKFFTS